VHQFPPLTVSRNPDWGWSMHNQYVIFQSYDEVLEAQREAELKEREERAREKEMSSITPSFLSSLSVKDLKERLGKWRVDIATCLEKSDLVEKALEYAEHYRRTKEEKKQKRGCQKNRD